MTEEGICWLFLMCVIPLYISALGRAWFSLRNRKVVNATPERQDLVPNTLEHQEIIVPILDLLGSLGHSGNSSAQSGGSLVRLWLGRRLLPLSCTWSFQRTNCYQMRSGPRVTQLRSGSALVLLAVCGFLTSCGKDFTT